MKNSAILILLVLVSVTFLCIKIYSIENERRSIKEDLIELSKVKYGLFSVDEWKQILAKIITKKIEEFNLTNSNKKEMRKRISELLYKVINDFEARYFEKRSKSLLGIIEGKITSMFGAFDKIKKDIPKFTEQILDFMNDPGNRKAVREYLTNKLNQYADKTFSKLDYTIHDSIIAKYKYSDRNTAIKGLTSRIESLDNQSLPYKVALLMIAIFCAVYVVVSKGLVKNEFLFLTFISFVLLFSGLLLPMIEIDARISRMTFTLLGESVSFTDQVLYYKSKSILEVVTLMLTQSRADVMLVGVLVFIFSVLFPLSKLMASILYIYGDRMRSNGFVRFLIFKTGKWSMADVMVIAIFMSYIGFSGIISEQLRQIENITEGIDILTTNKSSLLSGFFLFTSFAILSLLISHKLQYGSADQPAEKSVSE